MTIPRFLDETQLTILFRLTLAAVMGGLVGYERARSRHPAGLRINVLICVGATLFGMIPLYRFPGDAAEAGRIWQNILTGVGFLGAGVVFKEEHAVHGLTTAAGVWVVAAIGLSIAAGLYFLAFTGELVVLLTLFGLRRFERQIEGVGELPEGKPGGKGHEQ